MLNKAIKELMKENGIPASVLCIAMGKSESTYSRMFIHEDSNPKASDIALLARRLNIKVSEIYLKKESMEPVVCRFFYSAGQKSVGDGFDTERISRQVYIQGEWIEYTEMTSDTGSSNWDDVEFLGAANQWHIKIDGKIQCPDLYKQLCDEAKSTK